MSLFLFNDPWGYSRPSRGVNQHFGLVLDPEDWFAPLAHPDRSINRWLRTQSHARPWQTLASKRDVGSVVKFDGDKFIANLDVQQFAPEEITVKVIGEKTIQIEGRHEEKEDEHGYISRHFVRKYILPDGHDINKVQTKLSTDGILTITAPKNSVGPIEHREVPIVQTGQPMKKVENKAFEKGDVEKK